MSDVLLAALAQLQHRSLVLVWGEHCVPIAGSMCSLVLVRGEHCVSFAGITCVPPGTAGQQSLVQTCAHLRVQMFVPGLLHVLIPHGSVSV